MPLIHRGGDKPLPEPMLTWFTDNSYQWEISWVFPVKSPAGECQRPHRWLVMIGPDNGVVPTGANQVRTWHQAITWTNVDQVLWCHFKHNSLYDLEVIEHHLYKLIYTHRKSSCRFTLIIFQMHETQIIKLSRRINCYHQIIFQFHLHLNPFPHIPKYTASGLQITMRPDWLSAHREN